jgi:2-(1,2-epoxy-1,2-dihydrophenyl)acetyl-CoA isomerase
VFFKETHMTELVRHERVEEIGVVTLDIPKTRNALSREVLIALAERLETLAADAECRAIVLTGAGGHFCSGGDISGMQAPRPLPVGRARMEIGHRVVRAIAGGTKPVIAAVEGYAAGAGLSLVCASDYVVSSSAARYVASFGKVGLIPDLGLMWSLPQRVGLSEAKRMFASARVVEAAEAAELGICDRLVEPGQALSSAMEIAREFTVSAPLPVAVLKTIYLKGCESFEDALRYEVDNQAAMYLTSDHREAVAAFMEKRPVKFTGV